MGGGSGGGFTGTKGSGITKHGAERMKERGFTHKDVTETKANGIVKTQSDDAKVYINETHPGKFNIVVEGKNGPITVLKGLSQKSLARLLKNYGWR